MLHDSTLTTLAFLVVSVIFTRQYGCCVWAERIHIGNYFLETIWLINVIIPGVFSLLPVVLCPKLFILRIHRIWRLHLLKDYEERLQYYTSYSDIEGVADIRAERQYWSQKIDEVEKDRLDVRNFETIGAILSILLNVGVIVATLVS